MTNERSTKRIADAAAATALGCTVRWFSDGYSDDEPYCWCRDDVGHWTDEHNGWVDPLTGRKRYSLQRLEGRANDH